MKNTFTKTLKKKHNNKSSMPNIPVLAVIIGIFLFVVFLVPTQSVLTLSIGIPPNDNNVVIVNERITLAQSLSFPQKTSIGDIGVNITLLDSKNELKWTDTYVLRTGNWLIRTYQPISKSDRVIIEIPLYKYQKAIVVG